MREQQRAELIAYVRDRAVVDRLARDDPRSYARGRGATRSTPTC